ncbi:proline racemase family protein [Occallatibacter riparius]|uniref:Proline racemase family protein n=2 Tax=Occallatibacter riparius TaxID=1002689 RepID=A0A9J7BGQ8_9BACT|nr:proline racemase family protein [Occallatibacter riparius]UWZ81705.1 proline racemase family protein [Occallatibacter riparius]
MPIPHSGPRGSPETDVWQAVPASIIAAATLDPARTPTVRPLIEIDICSDDSKDIGELTTTPIVADCILRMSNTSFSHQDCRPAMTPAQHSLQKIVVLDSHTAGEPTRCVLSGGPDLGAGPLAKRLERLRTEHDHLRRAILCEPRGSDVIVGAWILPPDTPDCAAAVIFFNNAGYLGMCGHGTIGVAVTLAHLGRITPGAHRIQTPVGIVRVQLDSPNTATIENIPAYRHIANARVHVPQFGEIIGDVAWGGNWFFLIKDHPFDLRLENVDQLTDFTWAVRNALTSAEITGANRAEIDHIELFSDPLDPANHSRNFVLCPGKAYDRSPCGTGTSAKMACLIADGKLAPGETWRQEGILGTVFEGRVRMEGKQVIPSITGSAFVTAESTLLYDPTDPFRDGIG